MDTYDLGRVWERLTPDDRERDIDLCREIVAIERRARQEHESGCMALLEAEGDEANPDEISGAMAAQGDYSRRLVEGLTDKLDRLRADLIRSARERGD